MTGIVELRNVSCTAQGRRVVRNVSYEFAEGKTTARGGPSGGGKSTMLKAAAGLWAPDAGEILYKGKNIAQMNRAENLAFRKETAFVFQDSALWANQNLLQILDLPLRLHFPAMTRREREYRIEAVVSEVGYKKDLGIRPAQLSMGEQKLVAFARALLCRPGLLYLDEWTESLDENAAQRLISIVNRRRSEGVSVILVSHDTRIIRSIADVVVMVLGGQIFLSLTREQMAEDEDLRRYVEMGMGA
jgi:ABC-type lipoprotein export system ATPase subunit